jgi:hypothetical protein
MPNTQKRAEQLDRISLFVYLKKMVLNILKAMSKGLELPKRLLQINSKSNSPGLSKVMSRPSAARTEQLAPVSRPASR